MRVSAFTLISIVASLATYVAAYSSKSAYTARELVDEFATRDLEAFDYALERREILADLSTRNLIDELSDRLERRGGRRRRGFEGGYEGEGRRRVHVPVLHDSLQDGGRREGLLYEEPV
ncbi:hypothetical protein DFP72DRAFT_1172615 [Ephemerocybe angulata]|uniref:Uncharacterized protein n=1 Tax=Ephemerocybe angulata TaxID=980116 RepID=A0A8H6HPV9_9AGAR|nr:hypothetical protein DFP72DRAFT_1172615 [Tulosesus angulatus]